MSDHLAMQHHDDLEPDGQRTGACASGSMPEPSRCDAIALCRAGAGTGELRRPREDLARVRAHPPRRGGRVRQPGGRARAGPRLARRGPRDARRGPLSPGEPPGRPVPSDVAAAGHLDRDVRLAVASQGGTIPHDRSGGRSVDSMGGRRRGASRARRDRARRIPAPAAAARPHGRARDPLGRGRARDQQPAHIPARQPRARAPAATRRERERRSHATSWRATAKAGLLGRSCSPCSTRSRARTGCARSCATSDVLAGQRGAARAWSTCAASSRARCRWRGTRSVTARAS